NCRNPERLARQVYPDLSAAMAHHWRHDIDLMRGDLDFRRRRRRLQAFASVKTSTNSSTPLTGCGGNACNCVPFCNASRVVLLTSKLVLSVLFRASIRDATFTVFPITVNSMRSGEP